ncbi:hypothetical protein ACB092_02G110400 [Castanea dentata]
MTPLVVRRPATAPLLVRHPPLPIYRVVLPPPADSVGFETPPFGGGNSRGVGFETPPSGGGNAHGVGSKGESSLMGYKFRKGWICH